MKNCNRMSCGIGELRKRRLFCRTVAGVSSLVMLTTVTAPAFAGPTAVLGGDATLTGATGASLNAGSATDAYAQFVSSGGPSAVLDWSKFNVGAGKEMNFSGAGTTFFNLVDGAASKSQIDGIISGNGSVWVINPNGVAFGAGAQVNVGGLFAAAAGTVSNADALRDGTTQTPAFSSFAGTVDATKGRFSAEQVALLGKRVELGEKADFCDTLLLSVGGGEPLTVDTVVGGKVTIDVSAAAEFAGEAISVDGLFAGNAFVEMTAAGDASVRGEVGAGDLSVAATGSVAVKGDVTTTIGGVEAASVVKGDVTLNGSVASADGVTLMAAEGDVTVNGSVEAEGGVSVSAGLGYSAQTGEAVYNRGSVVIGENVSVVNKADGDVKLLAVNGSVSVGEGAKVVNGSDGLAAVMTLGEVPVSAGGERSAAVTVDGTISGEKVGFSAESGDIVVNGEINSAADVAAVANGGNVMLANAANRFGGTVGVVGKAVEINAADGLALGNVTAAGNVDVSTVAGDITVNGTVKTTVNDGSITLKAATDANADGSVIVNGTLDASVEGGQVIAIAGYGKLRASGKLMRALDNAGLISNEPVESLVRLNESATVLAGRLIQLEGEVGVISAGRIDARQAQLEVGGHRGDIDLYADGTGIVLAGSAGLRADGSVLAGNPNNEIGLVTELAYHDDLDLNLGGVGGEVTTIVTPDNFAESYAQTQGFLYDATGTILVLGDLNAPGSVYFISANGNVVVVKDCHVSVGNGGYAYFGAAQSVAINGTVDAHDIQLDAPNVSVGADAKLNANKTEGQVLVGVDASFFNSYAGYVDGKAEVNGEINAYKTHIGALGDVTQGEGSTIDTCEFDVASGLGSVFLRGVTKSWIADVVADGDIELANVSASMRYGKYLNPDGSVGYSSVDVVSSSGNIKVLSGGVVESTREQGGEVVLSAENGNVTVDGQVRAVTGAGQVSVVGAGDVVVNGRVEAGDRALVSSAGTAVNGTANVIVNGTVDGKVTAGVSAKSGGVTVNGSVLSDDVSLVSSHGGDIVVTGSVRSRGEGEVRGVMLSAENGDIAVNGTVCGEKDGVALVEIKKAGDVRIGENGIVQGKAGVTVVTEAGNLTQSGSGKVDVTRGYAPSVSLKPALSGEYVVLKVNGSVGGDNGGSLSVDGKVLGQVTGDASLAAANGGSLQGGTKQKAAEFIAAAGSFIGLDLSSLGDNTAVEAGGNLSIYTADKSENYTSFYAGGNLSLSAASFGDLSYMRSAGILSINNVGKPAHPQVAYFESVDGKEPRINNQANDVVIFVDGRLAGGNLKILNQFGANEAFLVSTPELKSTQGIFGNPTFLHSDLDVANPMEVSAIDYMLQETPRLTLDKDFPKEVDQHVDSVVIPEKDSIQFGREAKAEPAPASDDTVAMLK